MTLRPLFLFAIIILIGSCSRTTFSGSEADNLVIYPSPPDTARIQFLTKISGSEDITGKRKSFYRFLFGQPQNIPINKPYGIAVHNGKILICDTFIHGLVKIDLAESTFGQFIPKGKGELKVPVNCCVDEKGYLYIADSERKQIVIFDENGTYYNCFGEAENFKPVDVFAYDNKLWVTNLAGHQIHVYANDTTYELLNTFPQVGVDETGLFSPTNLFVNDSNVFVTDFGDFKVKKYTHDGEFVSSIGTYGQGIGQMARPKGIAVDRESNLYVVDAGFENAQIFNKEGKLLMHFGGSYKGPGDMWLPAKVILDYDNLRFFEKYVDPAYQLKYLILVSNQFGPDKLNIYGAIEPLKKGAGVDKKQESGHRKK
ncbi:MAG: hypothetical protein IPH20_23525 [Bacteroidales bacterium]|nr:hypothetical protein [Bacteroidales bacterium]